MSFFLSFFFFSSFVVVVVVVVVKGVLGKLLEHVIHFELP